jgi:hypothetical protein
MSPKSSDMIIYTGFGGNSGDQYTPDHFRDIIIENCMRFNNTPGSIVHSQDIVKAMSIDQLMKYTGAEYVTYIYKI